MWYREELGICHFYFQEPGGESKGVSAAGFCHHGAQPLMLGLKLPEGTSAPKFPSLPLTSVWLGVSTEAHISTVITPYRFLNFCKFGWYLFKWAQISAHSVYLNVLFPLASPGASAQRWQGAIGHTVGWRTCSGVSFLGKLMGLLSLPPQDEVTPLL